MDAGEQAGRPAAGRLPGDEFLDRLRRDYLAAWGAPTKLSSNRIGHITRVPRHSWGREVVSRPARVMPMTPDGPHMRRRSTAASGRPHQSIRDPGHWRELNMKIG